MRSNALRVYGGALRSGAPAGYGKPAGRGRV